MRADTPDLTTYRAVHAALRLATRRLAIAGTTLHAADRRRAEAFARYWHGYAEEVRRHHAFEDGVVLPAVVARVPAAAATVARLRQEHRELDALLGAADAAVAELAAGGRPAALRGVLTRLADRMDAHLDVEDAEVLPLLERHLSAAEIDALDRRAPRSAMPFAEAAVPSARPAGGPFALRALSALARRRCARLAAAALGAAASPLVVAA